MIVSTIGSIVSVVSSLRTLAPHALPLAHKKFADDVLDAFEENYADQAILMAAVKGARAVFDIPDDIDGDKD